jgi:adenylate cyclase
MDNHGSLSHQDKTIKTIGRELKVEYVLEGFLEKKDENIILNVFLNQVGRQKEQVFIKNYNHQINDHFSVQTDVVDDIAHEIDVKVKPEEKKVIQKAPTLNLSAYEYYLLGNERLKELVFTSDNQSAMDIFQNI